MKHVLNMASHQISMHIEHRVKASPFLCFHHSLSSRSYLPALGLISWLSSFREINKTQLTSSTNYKILLITATQFKPLKRSNLGTYSVQSIVSILITIIQLVTKMEVTQHCSRCSIATSILTLKQFHVDKILFSN